MMLERIFYRVLLNFELTYLIRKYNGTARACVNSEYHAGALLPNYRAPGKEAMSVYRRGLIWKGRHRLIGEKGKLRVIKSQKTCGKFIPVDNRMMISCTLQRCDARYLAGGGGGGNRGIEAIAV